MTIQIATDTQNDGRDDAEFQKRVQYWKDRGRNGCLWLALGILGASFVISLLLNITAFLVLDGLTKYANFTGMLITVWFGLWGLGVMFVLSQWKISINVPENRSWIIINIFPQKVDPTSPDQWKSNPMIKFPTGFYWIPPWWIAKLENLTNHEKLTIDLPDRDYPAREGKGGATLSDVSFTYFVPIGEAEGYITQDKSVITDRLVDAVKSEIGPVIAGFSSEDIVGQSSAVTTAISAHFGARVRSDTEKQCHVVILTVTVGEVSPDAKTKEQLQKKLDAAVEKERAEDQLSFLRKIGPDGKRTGDYIEDDKLRFDLQQRMGMTPARTIKDDKQVVEVKITTDDSTAAAFKGAGGEVGQALATAAGLIFAGKKLQGGGDSSSNNAGKSK